MGQMSSTVDSATSEGAASNTPSDFYLACRDGSVEAVERMLIQLNTTNSNRFEPNGSTSLHAASCYGHKTIVQMLLQHGAKPWTMNKFKMTPYQEAANEETRLLFRRPLEADINRFADDDILTGCLELIPEKKTDEYCNNIANGWINGYKNIGKDFRSRNIKQIVRVRITKYHLAKLQRSDDCARELQKILRANIPSDHSAYLNARFLFDEYCSRNQIEYLIRLYTLETNFYRALHTNVQPFVIEIYSQLSTLKKRFFSGHSYRGLSMMNINGLFEIKEN
jgi:hypothetical protein